MQAPQRWPGFAELWTTEPLPRLRDRLARVHATCPPPGPPPTVSDAIGISYGECGSWPASPLLSADKSRLLCSCPWGNRYVICAAPASFEPEGEHPGGRGTLVALRRLVHPVRPHAASAIAAFFADVLGCPASLVFDDAMGAPSCIVAFASGQSLAFVESADAPDADAYEADEATAGYHLAFYTASHETFGRAFDEAHRRGCLYCNARFEGGPPEFGNAMTPDVARACGQFRVRDIRNAAGALILMLELEVRSPRHISCPIEPCRDRQHV